MPGPAPTARPGSDLIVSFQDDPNHARTLFSDADFASIVDKEHGYHDQLPDHFQGEPS